MALDPTSTHWATTKRYPVRTGREGLRLDRRGNRSMARACPMAHAAAIPITRARISMNRSEIGAGVQSSSPGQFPNRGPPQIRTRRFPPSGSSTAMSYGPPRVLSATFKSCGDMFSVVNASAMFPS